MEFKLKMKAFKTYLLQYKGLGVVVSLIMIALGVLSFVFPGVVGTIAIWSFLLAMLISGLFSLICYFTCNADQKRYVFNLIKGLTNISISLILVIPLIINATKNGFFEALNTSTNKILYSITFVLGIYLTITGFIKMLNSNQVKLLGGNKWSEIILGATNIILGIALFILLMMNNNLGLSYVIGTYLILFSIMLIIELINNPLVQDKNKVYTLKKAKPNSKNEEVEVEIV